MEPIVTDRQELTGSNRNAASFRDPSGYVFQKENRIFRAIDQECYETLHFLAEKGLFSKLMEEGFLVKTRFVDEAALLQELSAEHPGYNHFLEHDLVSPITYPYEWTVSMLADAGIHTLDLQINLLEAGCSLKDATAYNIQFVNGKPKFIDLSSIERPRRLDLWFALGQFGQMFTFPLLLARHSGWDLRSYFLANIGGRTVEQVIRGFGWLERWRPRLLFDVTLPYKLNRKADRRQGDGREFLDKANPDSRAQLVNLKRLRGKVKKLAAGYQPQGVWSEYTKDCSYDDAATQAKKSLVKQFLKAIRPATVLDLGCNTGDYSFLAAECGARVLAADGDHDAVEILYRRLRQHPASITPLVLDLSNPSPAIGFRSQERANFFDRVKVDCVFALALLHHLLVSANLSLEAIRDLFYNLTEKSLVLEFVPRDDVMFKRLMKFRVDLFGELNLDLCRKVFLERFDLITEEPIMGSPRTLLFLRKQGAKAQ